VSNFLCYTQVMTKNPLIKYQKQISDLAKKHQISYLALFGSHARGEAQINSDIDLLVDFKETPGWVELYDVEQDYKKLFNKDIDMVEAAGINKYVKPYILPDLITLYGQRPASLS